MNSRNMLWTGQGHFQSVGEDILDANLCKNLAKKILVYDFFFVLMYKERSHL